MIDDHDVREMLLRRADTVPAPPVDTTKVVRRARRRLVLNSAVATVAAVAIVVTAFAGIEAIRTAPIPAEKPTPSPVPSSDLGVFAPVAGWIVYGDRDGIWGVDPAAAGASETRVQVSETGIPLGWSSDGTRLLIMREFDDGDGGGFHLFVMHADGSETQVTEQPMGWITGATISPDGSRVVFATYKAMYSVDVGGGPVEVFLEGSFVQAPTFAPDGAQIAYIVGSGDHSHRVWVVNADGSDPHQILANETTMGAGHVYGLAWSPTGDRIAFGNDVATYTFATDGSGFTRVITDGNRPYWSPDGSQFAFIIHRPGDGGRLAIANADGSNVRDLGFRTSSGPWTSGPWHPGAPVEEPAPAPTPIPVVPPAPSALAYWSDGDVYVADVDGSDAVRIADGVPDDGSNDDCADGGQHAQYDAAGTVWSPDGRYLAYWDHGCPVPPDAWGTVVVSDAEGNVIGSFPGEGWAVSWSPDSTRIAVMDVWGQGDATIGVYRLDGTRQAALTVPSSLTPSGDYSPVWSRDGSSILLPGVQVPVDGDAPTPFPTRYYGVYSPDGSRVAYLEGSYRGSLVVADAVLPDAQKANDPGEFWYVTWSPIGDLVAFVPDETELLVRDVATGADTSLVDVTQSEILSVIEFSPDGDRILFARWDADTSRSSLWSIGTDGSDLRRLVARVDGADLQPQGGPK
jgi:Tol biopolymer transport system component